MLVAQEDRSDGFRRTANLVKVLRIVRTRIEDKGGAGAHDPCVRPFQGEWARIGSQNSQDARHVRDDGRADRAVAPKDHGLPPLCGMATSRREPSTVGLAKRLHRRIAAGGAITFADFMESALYDPEDGFYSRLPVGEAGHFVTSPHVSPVFGRLVARQVAEFWDLLDRPKPFEVIEVGAGDGTLALQILDALPGELTSVLRYRAVERSAAGRRALDAKGLDAPESLGNFTEPFVGCLIANELLDNLPFHRLRGTSDGAAELLVGIEGDGFVLVEGPPSSAELLALAPPLAAGEEFVVSPATLRFVDEAAAVLVRGYIWLVDYGFIDASEGRSVHGYRDHRVHDAVLAEPGSTDITTGVDFAAVARHARSRGLEVWGPVSQREALISLGFRELDDQAHAHQVEALNARRGLDSLRVYSDRNRASLLIGREGLGAAKVICLGKNTTRRPRSARPH